MAMVVCLGVCGDDVLVADAVVVVGRQTNAKVNPWWFARGEWRDTGNGGEEKSQEVGAIDSWYEIGCQAKCIPFELVGLC